MLFRKQRRTNRHLDRLARPARRDAAPRGGARSEKDRRGTVLLIALGALGVISLAGLSYVTFVRLDRLGSTTHARVANFQQQVDATTDWIGTLLTADLYGNKVISPTTPANNFQFENNPDRRIAVWPSRFEDGEFRDYPITDMRTFAPEPLNDFTGQGSYDRARLNPMPRNTLFTASAGSRRFEVAPADDAWLAPIEPVWNTFDLPTSLEWNSIWPSITNLRSAYVYIDNADDPQNPTPGDLTDDAYVRQDGRYADLGQFFLDPITLGGTRRANPGAFLSVVEPGRGAGQALDPNEALFVPMSAKADQAGGNLRTSPFENLDERFWVDTDGDLRADARWQELDALGSLFGYNWVVGARIIDMSGMVNINTATTANYGADPAFLTAQQQLLPTGRTPADVDLFRVLGTAIFDAPGQSWYGNPNTRWDFNTDSARNPNLNIRIDQLVQQAFHDHLNDGLGFFEVAVDQNLVQPNQVRVFTPTDNASLIPRGWRDAHYLNAGADPRSPASPGARSYPATEMIDLVTFWGGNRRALVTRLEERLDGPLGAQGYLPSPSDPDQEFFGPMGSARTEAATRRFPTAGDTRPRPTAQEIRWGVRNVLTTDSGAAGFSPVPVLNSDALNPDGDFQPWVGVGDRIVLGRDDDAGRIFNAYLWALAPLAVNEPLTGDLIRPQRDLDNANAYNVFSGARLAANVSGVPGETPGPAPGDRFLSTSYHYGGGLLGEAERLLGDANTSITGGFDSTGLSLVPSAEVDTTGASYAVLTSLKLAANTIDAFDTDTRPTVLRFFATQTPDAAAASPTNAFVFDARGTDAIELGTRTPFGEVPGNLLDQRVVGRKINNQAAENVYFDDQRGESGDPGSALEALNGFNTVTGLPDFSDPMLGAGVTIVGLERQPYIEEVVSIAVYSNAQEDTGVAATENAIFPNRANNQVGSVLAVKLYNPWPDTIPVGALRDLEVWIMHPQSGGELLDDFVPPADPARARAVPLKLGVLDPQAIPPGGSLVLELVGGDEDRIIAQRPGFAWAYGISNAIVDTNGDGEVDALDRNPRLEIVNGAQLDEATAADALTSYSNDDPVFFNSWAGNGPGGAGPRVVLMRRVEGVERPVPIDMLEGDRGDEFPVPLGVIPSSLSPSDRDGYNIQLVGNIASPGGGPGGAAGDGPLFESDAIFVEGAGDVTPVYALAELRDALAAGNVIVRGRVAVASSLSRPIGVTAGSGMSSAVLDFGEAVSEGRAFSLSPDAEDRPFSYVWLEAAQITTAPDTYEDSISQKLRDAADTVTSFNTEGETFADANLAGLGLNPWEVLIPDRAPFSKADLALISKHAHFCVNHRLNRFDAWRTVGQQLAAEARSSGFATQTLGVLDLASSLPGMTTRTNPADPLPSAFYPNVSPQGVLPDEQLSMPLALRVFEAFEALNPAAFGGRYNGRVNINTATERVLEALPWVAPAQPLGGSLNVASNGVRARAMLAYRDGNTSNTPAAPTDVFRILSGDVIGFRPEFLTNLTNALVPAAIPPVGSDASNLRRRDITAIRNGRSLDGFPDLGRGFAAAGELAILDAWEPADIARNFLAQPNASGMTAPFFGDAQLASGFTREHAFDGGAGGSALDAAGNPFNLDDRQNYDVPENGQAERLALYRSLANIVETRSDVYGAWFVLRAYDPNQIESIVIENTADPLSHMEDERFRPAYESRWFVLFDRSNVDAPNQKPEILMQVELPSARP